MKEKPWNTYRCGNVRQAQNSLLRFFVGSTRNVTSNYKRYTNAKLKVISYRKAQERGKRVVVILW